MSLEEKKHLSSAIWRSQRERSKALQNHLYIYRRVGSWWRGAGRWLPDCPAVPGFRGSAFAKASGVFLCLLSFSLNKSKKIWTCRYSEIPYHTSSNILI